LEQAAARSPRRPEEPLPEPAAPDMSAAPDAAEAEAEAEAEAPADAA